MALVKRYFTNGTVDDDKFTGLTLAEFTFDDEADEGRGQWVGVQMSGGQPYFGYMAKEITKLEYDDLAYQIANIAESKYELGIFGNGLITAKNLKRFEKARAEAIETVNSQIADGLDSAWQRAVRLAKTSGGTPREVLQDFRPDIKPEILDILEARHK